MQNTLLSSLLIDIVSVLKSSENFFDQEHKARLVAMEKLEFSSTVKAYLGSVAMKNFVADMEEIAKNMLASPYKQNRTVGLNVIELLSTYFDYQTDLDLSAAIGESETSHYVLVQSPVKLETKFKDEIRENLIKKYPNSSPIFVVNKDLIGGLRIYVDGHTEDLSWISKINILTSINKVK